MARSIQSLALVACLSFTGSAQVAGPSPGEHPRPTFLENRGQWPSQVRFRRFAGGSTAWLVDDGWWLVLRGESDSPGALGDAGRPAVALRMQFEGAHSVAPQGFEKAPGQYNFLLGADSEAWVRGARSSARVVWSGLYDGLDLVARGGPEGLAGGLFEYDLELAPGADLEGVKIKLEGHTGLHLDATGNLVVETAVGPLVQAPPVAWQWRGDERLPLACHFTLLGDDHFGFAAPERDPELRAVVDPALLFSTYLSGQLGQEVTAVSAGPGGTVYVAGWTLSDDFPSTPGSFQEFSAGNEDGFVTRLSADGTQFVWSTFLGGSDIDVLNGMVVDAVGAATLCGQTRSSDFPTLAGSYDPTPNGFTDGWVARLAPTGDALEWSTYIGGGLNDFCSALDIDGAGNVTVVGRTNGSGFPAIGGFDTTFNGGVFAGDAFVARFSGDGTALVWSTYLGGPQDDAATTVVVESTGEVCVSGTTSGSFPITPSAFDKTYSGAVDTFVTRIAAAGNGIVYSTYFGNVLDTTVKSMVVDGSGEVVLLGRTEDPQFPLTAGAFRTTFAGPAEGFYTRLDDKGSALLESTFIGGEQDDEVIAAARDATGRVWLAGNTTSADLPTTPGSYAPDYHANLSLLTTDAFLLRFDAALGAVDYGTYFGTNAEDTLAGFDLDASGALVFAGSTNSFQFPTSPGAVQETFNPAATGEGFAVRLTTLLHPFTYGNQGTPGGARIFWSGFPALGESFSIQIDNATPGKKAILFHGFAPTSKPFFGLTLLVQPPLFRHRPVLTSSFLGYKSVPVKLDPAWVGQSVYYQWWYRDPFNPKKKTGLSDALQVFVHP